ncbi:hypothetical protein QZH41_002432 [Actinostola sp. cb2023]|nr:hypothetical protein QZH41_002432 [Actinostola sp. cb2023]
MNADQLAEILHGFSATFAASQQVTNQQLAALLKESHPPGSGGYTTKPPIFRGDGVDDVDQFLSSFDRYANFFSWPAEKRVRALPLSLADSFDTLKRTLVSAPILAFPNFSILFHLYVDASLDGLGMALGQIQDGREVAIAYAGRDLNKAERNYSATEREALAVVAGIKKFQSYLYGRHFVVHTDHSALKWLMKIKEPTGRLARWSLLLQQFDFTIEHRAGTSNGNADALSRRPYHNVSTLSPTELPVERVRLQQRRDPELADLIVYLEDDSLPKSNGLARRILLHNDAFYLSDEGLLFHLSIANPRRTKGTHSQLVVPRALHHEVLVQAHDNVLAGHLGVHKTYEKLRDRYYWRGMYKDAEHWCKSCVDCAMRKTPRNHAKAPLLPIPVEGPFHRVAVDVMGPLTPTETVAEHRKRVVQNIEECQRLALENIQRSQQKMKAYYDRRARTPNFEVGEKYRCGNPVDYR